MKQLGKLLGFVQDHPLVVTSAMAILVAAHALLTGFAAMPNVWVALMDPARADPIASLCLGIAGSSSLVGGFAGVIIIFGLDSGSSRFRMFRARGGKALQANWISTMSSAFAAVGLCLIAALFSTAKELIAVPWLIEMALGLLVHATVRMIWLMRRLMHLVKLEDARAIDESNVKPIPPFGRKRTNG